MKRNHENQITLKGWTLKEISSVVFVLLLTVGIGGNVVYQKWSDNQEKNQRIEQLQLEVIKYEARMTTCVKANEVFPFFYSNNPRSQERLTEVIEGFRKIAEADCFVFRSDKIYTNPYKNLTVGNFIEVPRSGNEEELFQGLLYEVDKGIPFLVTGGSICADGSYSGSVGRGTCSWHGGYATKRGYNFDYGASVYEYDPRLELSSLQE
jgi:hypothetical protein